MVETFSLDEIRQKLTPDIRAVYMQATESSTGARHDVESIARLVRESGHDTLLVVDAITGLGTTHFDVDGWGIDVIIGGSQKALMIPPGLAYCAVSERAWKRMETAKSPRYYFDFRRERKAAAKGRIGVHASDIVVCGVGSGAGLHTADGRWRSGGWAQGADRQRRTGGRDDSRRRAGAGTGTVCSDVSAAALTAIHSPSGVDSSAMVKTIPRILRRGRC